MTSQKSIYQEMSKSETRIKVKMIYDESTPSRCLEIFKLLSTISDEGLRNYVISNGGNNSLDFDSRNNTLIFNCPHFRAKSKKESNFLTMYLACRHIEDVTDQIIEIQKEMITNMDLAISRMEKDTS